MTGYNIVSLKDMLDQMEEDKVKRILFSFSCPNKDVESFIKRSAITLANQGVAATHLVFTSYKNEIVLAGYFTIATKSIAISDKIKSKTFKKRIAKFAYHQKDLKAYILAAPLIGQLGRNFKYKEKLITGDELMVMALDKISSVQREVGGKYTYLECEDKEILKEFYARHGFVDFGKRKLEKTEQNFMEGEYLIQMIKYMKTDKTKS